MSNPTAPRQAAGRQRAAPLLAVMIFGAALALSDTVSASEVTVKNMYAASVPFGGYATPPMQTAATGVVSQTAAIEAFGSGGRGVASAGLGALQSSSTASANGNFANPNDAAQGQARADAVWYDLVTINGAGLSGTGTAHARIFVQPPAGGMTNSGVAGVGAGFRATAYAGFGVRVGGNLLSFDTQAQLTQLGIDTLYTYTRVNNVDFAGALGGFWDISFPITFGQAFGTEGYLVTTAMTLAGGNATTNSFANGYSIYWAGITSITLASGATTTAFSALGDTAYDWKVSAAPVPESTSALLLLLGLGAMTRLPAFRRKVESAGLVRG